MSDLESLIRRIAREEAQAVLRAKPPVAQPDPSALLSQGEVGALLGSNRRALSERFRRERKAGRQHPLEKMAVEIDGTKRWPRQAVLAYLATIGAGK